LCQFRAGDGPARATGPGAVGSALSEAANDADAVRVLVGALVTNCVGVGVCLSDGVNRPEGVNESFGVKECDRDGAASTFAAPAKEQEAADSARNSTEVPAPETEPEPEPTIVTRRPHQRRHTAVKVVSRRAVPQSRSFQQVPLKAAAVVKVEPVRRARPAETEKPANHREHVERTPMAEQMKAKRAPPPAVVAPPPGTTSDHPGAGRALGGCIRHRIVADYDHAL